MSMELSGFDELIDKLDKLENVGDKVKRTAVKKGAEIVLKHFKNSAPADTRNSRRSLKVTSTKKFKNGDTWSQVGIDRSNWNKTKGLYFQNYGYVHKRSGKKINKHVGWVSKEFKKVEGQASKVIEQEVKNELGKIL